MRVALVCDDLIQFGGHENVILELCKTFPEAVLHTTAASRKWQNKCRELNITLKTSFVQKLPFIEKLNRLYSVFLVHILALESFKFDGYDLVISMSSRFAHGVITKPHTLHISYLSTVGRMFWEPNTYFEHEDFGVFKKLANALLTFPLSYIRLWDKVASARPDYLLTNSKTTSDRIKKYYARTSVIINPSLDTRKFRWEESSDYFLVITRLVSWKRVDIAIKACGELGVKLKILGTGSHENALKKMARDYTSVEVLGYVSEEKKVEILAKCRALINTQFEDFGLVPLEAMASGKPVIAYKKGGVLETILEGVTGEFFEYQDSDHLKNVLVSFNPSKYKGVDCIKNAQKFDKKVFRQKIRDFVSSVY